LFVVYKYNYATATLGPIFVSLGDGHSPLPKPAADLPLAALSALRCKAEHALMVGDALTDAEAAVAAGVSFALVTSSAHGQWAAAELSTPSKAAAALGFAAALGTPVGGGVHADVLDAVQAHLTALDRQRAQRALERLLAPARSMPVRAVVL